MCVTPPFFTGPCYGILTTRTCRIRAKSGTAPWTARWLCPANPLWAFCVLSGSAFCLHLSLPPRVAGTARVAVHSCDATPRPSATWKGHQMSEWTKQASRNAPEEQASRGSGQGWHQGRGGIRTNSSHFNLESWPQ